MEFRDFIVYGIGKYIPDSIWIQIKYFQHFHKFANLKNPETFNEKIQWLKLNVRKKEYTRLVDKYMVREFIRENIGEEYLIPLLGVWDNPDEIDFESLPSQFVLKCNHNSGGGMCICKNKETLDICEVRNKLKKALNKNYFWEGREWPYKNVKPKILCEKYMCDNEQPELIDYKFMCFYGKVLCSFVCTERFSSDGLKVTFFDREWKELPFERHYKKSGHEIHKPLNYERMVELAECLSNGMSFVRVDLYEIHGQIYFGEFTFFPGGGLEEFTPESWDYELGAWLKIPVKVDEGELM